MKKVTQSIICIVLVLTACISLTSSAFAKPPLTTYESTTTNNPYRIQTNETAMPKVHTQKSTASRGVASSTLLSDVRANWTKETSAILEASYHQKIDTISETNDFIVFEFVPGDQTVDGTSYVDRIEYIKPESELYSNSYETKFTYIWGYTNKFHVVGEANGFWRAIKDVSIAVAGLTAPLTVASFVYSVCSVGSGYFQDTQKVSVRSEAKYYFLNKVTYLKEPVFGYWLPYCYAGIRKDFCRQTVDEVDSYGEVHEVKHIVPPDGNPQSNPNNYDNIETSKHFYNDQWLIDKAIYLYETDSDVYDESYGNPDTPHMGDEIP